MKKLKVEMNFTKDLKDRMIVFAPHKMNIVQWPNVVEIIKEWSGFDKKKKEV